MNETKIPDRFVVLDEVKRRVGLGKTMIYHLIREGSFHHRTSSLPSHRDGVTGRSSHGAKDGYEGKKRKKQDLSRGI